MKKKKKKMKKKKRKKMKKYACRPIPDFPFESRDY